MMCRSPRRCWSDPLASPTWPREFCHAKGQGGMTIAAITEQTRQAIDDHLSQRRETPSSFLFPGRGSAEHLSTRQYARLLAGWLAMIGLDPCFYGTHSLRRTKATLIYKKTGNLRAVQLLLGHTKTPVWYPRERCRPLPPRNTATPQQGLTVTDKGQDELGVRSVNLGCSSFSCRKAPLGFAS